MKKHTFIYALKDPRDNSIRYVGQSAKPKIRYSQHLVDKSSNPHKATWIGNLQAVGLRPRMHILETVDEGDWSEAERYWIGVAYRRGWPLTNIQGYYANDGKPYQEDEGLDEIMWFYLCDKSWNRYCGFDLRLKEEIMRATALAMADESVVSLKAKGMMPFIFDQDIRHKCGAYMAYNLVWADEIGYKKLLAESEKQAGEMIERVTDYIHIVYGH